MSVGNDVVDLADTESRTASLHPRWAERVFCAAEHAALEASPSRHRLHWALWAAKESAYKARKRRHPETAFSPREFVVELSPLPPGDGVALGRVVHRGAAFAVEVRLDGDCLQAVATSANEERGLVGRTNNRLVVKAAAAAGDPSRDVRRLAAETLGSALQLDPAQIEVAGRPPVVRHDGRPVEATVSLSHHGRFVAFAGVLSSDPRTV